jgi:hypothetical protein
VAKEKDEEKTTLRVGDLRNAIKDLPSKLQVELHVMDGDSSIKMEGRLEFFTTAKVDHDTKTILRLYATAEYLGGMS